jgi:hypothetical protein
MSADEKEEKDETQDKDETEEKEAKEDNDEIAHVETDEIPGDQLRAITNNYDAEVVTKGGDHGSASGVTKSDAIDGALGDIERNK